jgi:DNA-binding CsgD family transcriptional regulator
MNTKKCKSIVEHVIYDFFGKGDLSKYHQLVAENVQVYCPSGWQSIHASNVRGREIAKKRDQVYAKAFSIKTIEIEDLLISQDKILARWVCEGIHKGHFFDFKATQHQFHLSGQTIYRFNDEIQIEEVWQAWDLMGLLSQIRTEMPQKSREEGVKDVDKLLKIAELLSKREKEVLRYLLSGKTAKESAIHMKLSFRTVEYYLENIKDKLGCINKRELFPYARLLEKIHLL